MQIPDKTPRTPRHQLARTVMGESSDTALAKAESEQVSSAITGLTSTFAAQAAESLQIDENSPEQHILDIYYNLDRLRFFMEQLVTRFGERNFPYQKLYSDQNSQSLKHLFENLNLIASRLGLNFKTEGALQALTTSLQEFQNGLLQEPEVKSYERKYTALGVLKNLEKYIVALQEKISENRPDFDGNYPAQLTEEALDKTEVLSKDTGKIMKSLLPGEEIIYPGDIEYGDSEYEKVVQELDKMKNKNRLGQLFKLLYRNKSELLLTNPDIKQKFSPEEIRQFRLALYRTIANLTIGIIDAIPAGAGDSVSWGADLSKVLKRVVYRFRITQKIFGKIIPEWADLTPDVSAFEAVMSEITELPTVGMIPSHLVFEFRKQFKADLPRIISFLEKLSRERAKLADELDEGTVTVLGLNVGEEKDLLKELKSLQQAPENI
jgi:hypothetical protein